MKQYKCLTKEPTVASAIYVPYYASLDVGRYLWDPDGFMRDYDAVNLVKWLAARPEWKIMWGRDHLLVTGRINWDFRRDHKNESDWGNELLNFSESRNVTIFLISGETTHHLRFRFWSRVSRPRPRASPPPRRVPLAFVGRPIETANQETLEALYRQARDAYYSEEPLIVDDMFDRVELKLRCYGSKLVVKYPRGSIRLHSTYADAEEDSSQVLALASIWILIFACGCTLCLVPIIYTISLAYQDPSSSDISYGSQASNFEFLATVNGILFMAIGSVIGYPLASAAVRVLQRLWRNDLVALKGACPNCGEEQSVSRIGRRWVYGRVYLVSRRDRSRRWM